MTLGGLVVVARDAATVALTGAPCGGLEWGAPVSLAAGTRIELGLPAYGLRSYLAVRGGIEVPAVLGSRSTDTLSGLGPAALAAGDLLPVGRGAYDVSSAVAVPFAVSPELPIGVIAGPREDWFEQEALRVLSATRWRVRPECDRIGIRLDGPPLRRHRDGELPSEPTLPGALQVPPDGRPIVLGPDAPVTGGYPVIAVVCDFHFDRLAQLRPGEPVRFSLIRGPLEA